MINVLLSCLNTRIRSFCLVAGTLFLLGCGSESNPIAPADPGLLISHELITTYESQDFERVKSIVLDSFFIGAQMNASDFRGKLVSTFGKVSMYRVAYETMIPELGNQKVIAYGLVAIPEGATNGTPILSYQHGTTFTKEEAPSNFQRHMETKLALHRCCSGLHR
jgi:hypothetical protein